MSKRGKRGSKKATKKNNDVPDISLHEILSKDENVLMEEYKMLYAENRLKTFRDWPFDEGSSCNPESLAEAGFYHIPSSEAPDACRCFACYKELDGWEPMDCPWDEHKKHSPKCEFLALNKPTTELTVREVERIHVQRLKHQVDKLVNSKVQELESYTKTVEAEIRKMAD